MLQEKDTGLPLAGSLLLSHQGIPQNQRSESVQPPPVTIDVDLAGSHQDDDLDDIVQILVNATTWGDLVRQVLLSGAQSTRKKYCRQFRHFVAYVQNNYSVTIRMPCSILVMVDYLAYVSDATKSYASTLLAFSVLKWFHELIPYPSKQEGPVDTPMLRNAVEAARRQYSKPIQRKEPLITLEILRTICSSFGNSNCNVIIKELRTAVMFSLGFYGLLRSNELLDLCVCGVKFAEDHLELAITISIGEAM